MNNVAAVTKLHLNKRALTLATPPGILVLMILITVIIALGLQRSGLDPNSEAYVSGFGNNTGVVGSITGFLVYLGVQAVATTFPFGMSLGTTRSAYTLGTFIYFLIQSAYVAVIAVVLLFLEKATDHWFVHAYALDTSLMGGGNPLKLMAIMFVLTLTALSIGGAFGAVFVKAGAKGPLIVGIVLAVVLALSVLVLMPSFSVIFASGVMAKLLGLGLGITVLALGGTYFSLRGASVR